jgi:hypothetical protein
MHNATNRLNYMTLVTCIAADFVAFPFVPPLRKRTSSDG